MCDSYCQPWCQWSMFVSEECDLYLLPMFMSVKDMEISPVTAFTKWRIGFISFVGDCTSEEHEFFLEQELLVKNIIYIYFQCLCQWKAWLRSNISMYASEGAWCIYSVRVGERHSYYSFIFAVAKLRPFFVWQWVCVVNLYTILYNPWTDRVRRRWTDKI